MGLKIERYYPIVVALAGAAAWVYFSMKLPTDEKEFLAAALSLGAVLTGFIATAQAILMALPSDSIMARLRASGYIPELVGYIGSALFGGVIFCTLCLIGFFILSSCSLAKLIFSTAFVFVGIFTLLSFYRVTSIMMKIMRS